MATIKMIAEIILAIIVICIITGFVWAIVDVEKEQKEYDQGYVPFDWRKFEKNLNNKSIHKNNFRKGAIITGVVCFILILIVALSIHANAQAHTSWGMGYDLTQKNTIGLFGFGFEKDKIVIDADASFAFNHSIKSNNLMAVKLGYDFAGLIVPQIGYFYNLKSNDYKELNYSAIGYSLKIILPITKIRENGSGFFVSAIYVNKQTQILAGLHAVL